MKWVLYHIIEYVLLEPSWLVLIFATQWFSENSQDYDFALKFCCQNEWLVSEFATLKQFTTKIKKKFVKLWLPDYSNISRIHTVWLEIELVHSAHFFDISDLSPPVYWPKKLVQSTAFFFQITVFSVASRYTKVFWWNF